VKFCAAICPICGGENECQFARTDTYKGRCWCAAEDFPRALLERIPEAARNVSCVCRKCVVAAQQAEANPGAPLAPVEGDFYLEGETMVFTEQYHRRRGYCCGSGCRHCPYEPRK
jgi:hypothetical protein